ncbi:(4Fe-4S)-binding protein [Cellulomonas sp. HZM]|uniref:(4Fe-4S)-binding protein n=1 Tax=Cellulomonas sp. HZM TaxID=1454010 RepID=UPI000B1526E6|nr:(4Fe-4S)-binding protein [Cellulomonas sp. HZM]
MTDREYTGTGIVVRYDVTRCRHVAECVRGAPEVFEPGRRPWILPDADPDAEHVADVVRRCPTGALHYQLAHGEPERPDPTTTVTAVPDGPLLVRGDLRLNGPDGPVAETRAALCRCGSSANKPFCDGSHERVGWRSDASTDEEPGCDRPHSESVVPPSAT